MSDRPRDSFYRRVAAHAALPYLELDPPEGAVDPAVAARVPGWAARAYAVAPVRVREGRLLVATSRPADDRALAAIRGISGLDLDVAVAPPDAVERAIAHVYGGPGENPLQALRGAAAAPASDEEVARVRRLAESLGLPFVRLEPAESVDPVNAAVAQRVSARTARRLGLLPVAADGGVVTVVLAEPLPHGERLAEELVRAPVRLALAPPADVARAIARVFPTAPAAVPPRTAVPLTPRERDRRLGEVLVETGLVGRDAIAEALRVQERTGGRIGEVLLHAGLISEEDLAASLAAQLRIPLADVSALKPEPSAVALLPEPLIRRLRVVPLAIHEHVLYLAAADPLEDRDVAAIRGHTQLPIRTVLTSRRALETLIQRLFADRYTQVATAELLNRSPEESAYRTLSRGQKIVFGGAAVLFLLFLVRYPVSTLVAFNIGSILFYGGFSLYKFKVIYDALEHELELPVTREEIEALDDRDLPMYTVLVPLYREAAVARRIVRALARLDYPRAKLDVKLLVEEDDEETRAALEAGDLPPHLRLVVVPDSLPKTKPKACNYGLIHAEGKYVVIYDAEDRPEPDQLKKAVVAFAKAGERVVCIQCKLNYYNRNQNLLTRWFTSEYSSWFDLLMPGLDAADSPIPLGGTSNHILREKLVELGAWDPFNVTEDADLGIRLHKAGYKTAIIDSTTFEEANSDLYNWIRQRSRWVKGYIQTWLVHMRHPLRLYRQIGFRSFVSFQFVVGGTFFAFLLNPVYWVLTTLWLLTHAGVIRELFPSFVYYAAALGLYVGNFVFTYVNVVGTIRRGYHDLVKWALLSPIYWGLMSIGAWKGFLQLIYRPFYWEKTVHGLDHGEPGTVEPVPAPARGGAA